MTAIPAPRRSGAAADSYAEERSPGAGHFDHAVIEMLPAVGTGTHITRWFGDHIDLDLAMAGSRGRTGRPARSRFQYG